MIRRLISIIIIVPLAVALIALAVANRGFVPLRLDVFNPQNPALTVNAPMFIWLFGAVAVGVVAGGAGTWFAQGKNRKLKRRYKKEADSLRFEVADTKRKTPDDAEIGKSLALSR